MDKPFLTLKKNKWINAINYEYIYTKRQSGDTPPPIDNSRGGPGGWDNYYNHFLYTDGWTSDGFTVGNPLFSSRSSTGLGINLAVSNNRIVAHHIGVDYDKPSLVYTCNSCGHHSQESVMQASCFNCRTVQPVDALIERKIYNYELKSNSCFLL